MSRVPHIEIEVRLEDLPIVGARQTRGQRPAGERRVNDAACDSHLPIAVGHRAALTGTRQ